LTSQTPCRSAVFGFRRQVRNASGRFSPSDCPSEGTATCVAQVSSTANFSSGQTLWKLARLRSVQCNPKRDSGRSEHTPVLVRPSGRERSLRGARCSFGSPKSSFAIVPLRRCIPGVGFPRRFADRERRDSPAGFWLRSGPAAPGELAHLGCGTELAILPNSGSNFGSADFRQRRWETSPRDVAKCPKDLEGDPSPGRTGSGCAVKRAARFQTPTGSKATKSSKRHGGKGCSDATRL